MSEEATNQPLKMIPTVSKSQISQDFAFPIGAEALSRGLAGVPQFDVLTLGFGGPLQSRRQIDHGNVALLLMSVVYRQPPLTLLPTHNEPHRPAQKESWDLYVFPVGRKNRYEIKQLLLGEGIQIIREWLTLPKTQAWRYGMHTLTIEVDVDDKTLLFSEDKK